MTALQLLPEVPGSSACQVPAAAGRLALAVSDGASVAVLLAYSDRQSAMVEIHPAGLRVLAMAATEAADALERPR